MSPEIIIVAIGCYLFCGVSEKIYRLQTGDWRDAGYYDNLEKSLSEFLFTPKQTKYQSVIDKFGNNYATQRTYRIIRKQKYNGDKYYFNKELRYIHRKVYSIRNSILQMSCTSTLTLSLFFKDNVLVFYHIYDSRINENNCGEYLGELNTITDESWLPGGENYTGSIYNCNEKFYEIFTLEHREKWDNARDCDFYKDKTYWEDPVYKDREYVGKRTGQPCTGFFNTECKLDY